MTAVMLLCYVGFSLCASAVSRVASLKVSSTTQTTVTVKWDKVASANSYRVYRYDSKTEKWTHIKSTKSTQFTEKELSPGKQYIYGVKAVAKENGKNVGSKMSKKAVAVTKPKTVKGLKASSKSATSITLKWNKLSGVRGYAVYRYDSSTKKYTLIERTLSNSYKVKNLKAGTSYTFAVRAYVKYSSLTYGSYSSKLKVKTASAASAVKNPGVPTGLEGAENSSNGIRLKWKSVSGATGYEVYSYDASNGSWVYEGSCTGTVYTVKNLTETSHYKYKVRAYKTVDGNKYYGDFCESVTVAYNSGVNDSIYSEEMEKSGVFGYLFDPDELYFYTADDPWQRNVGYNSIFDTTSNIALIDFDTVRLRFEYGGKDWMIQLWKGQYGLLFYGAEVGVYTKSKDRELMHYDCASDDEMLKMSMDFLEKKNGTWTRRFTRPYGYYWWCTGFIPGNKWGDYSGLGLDMRITAKDEDMLKGLKVALEQNNMQYRVSGLDVYFSYR